MINILAFSGSTRSGSYNKKILSLAVQGAQEADAYVTVINLLDYKLPIYDGDLEDSDGIPVNCTKLKKLFLTHQGLLLALPEYNSSFSAVFKNCIDWISRPTPGETEPLPCFKNKIAALMSASTGKLGGIRGLTQARTMLQNINVLVIPNQICIPCADTAFDDRGLLKEQKSSLALHKLGNELANFINKVNDSVASIPQNNHHESTPVKLPSKQDKKLIHEFENEGGAI
jgi:chromate reductase